MVGTSLYETALGWTAMHTASFLASGRVPRPHGHGEFRHRALQGVRSDRRLARDRGRQRQSFRAARRCARPSGAGRAIRDSAAIPSACATASGSMRCIADVIRTAPRDAWLAKLDAAGVPCAPMLAVDEVLAHPQSQAVGMLQPAPDGSEAARWGCRFSSTASGRRSAAAPPALGEGTELVLKRSAQRERGRMNIPANLNTMKVEAPEPGLWIAGFNRPEVRNALNTATSRGPAHDLRPARLHARRSALHHPHRRRRPGVQRGRRPQGAPGHERRRLAPAARHHRGRHLCDPQFVGAGHRRGQRRGARRRLRDGAVLRFHLCGGDRALRAPGGHARHHAGRRRHAEPAARGRRAPRQGADPERAAVQRAGGARLGHGQCRVSSRPS